MTAQQAAVIAIAFQRQKQISKVMPASIEGLNSDFLPESPSRSDPFTGQQLGTITRNIGVVVYGAGHNRKDDGGEVKPINEFEDPKDIGVILGWPNSSSLPE